MRVPDTGGERPHCKAWGWQWSVPLPPSKDRPQNQALKSFGVFSEAKSQLGLQLWARVQLGELCCPLRWWHIRVTARHKRCHRVWLRAMTGLVPLGHHPDPSPCSQPSAGFGSSSRGAAHEATGC